MMKMMMISMMIYDNGGYDDTMQKVSNTYEYQTF